MALTKEAKTKVVEELIVNLGSSKLTVAARYSGTSVKDMQALRDEARTSDTKVTIAKNRLFKKALIDIGFDEAAKSMPLTGQLMYTFNDTDEVAPAQVLANFAKSHPQIELVTGLNAVGQVLASEDLTMLANLPTKPQLQAQLIGTLSAPFNNFVGALASSNRRILHLLKARAEQVS